MSAVERPDHQSYWEQYGPEEIMAMSLRDLLQVRPENVDRIMFPEEITYIFTQCKAFWMYDGPPNVHRPHAKTTDGLCTNGFINTGRVLSYSRLCRLLASQLVRFLPSRPEGWSTCWFIGSNHAAVSLAATVSDLVGGRHEFPDKGTVGRKQIWCREEIDRSETVCQVEELITTAATLHRVREGIREGNRTSVTFEPFVLALVHRSRAYDFEGGPIHHSAHYDITNWDPRKGDICPYCAAGSKLIDSPKQRWFELTGQR